MEDDQGRFKESFSTCMSKGYLEYIYIYKKKDNQKRTLSLMTVVSNILYVFFIFNYLRGEINNENILSKLRKQ